MHLQDPIFALPLDLRSEIFEKLPFCAISKCCQVSKLWLEWLEEFLPLELYGIRYNIANKKFIHLSDEDAYLYSMWNTCRNLSTLICGIYAFKEAFQSNRTLPDRLCALAASTFSIPGCLLASKIIDCIGGDSSPFLSLTLELGGSLGLISLLINKALEGVCEENQKERTDYYLKRQHFRKKIVFIRNKQK